MKTRPFLTGLLPVLLLAACQEPSPPEMRPLEFAPSKQVSDAVANDMVKDDVQDLFKRMDPGFQTVVKDAKDVKKVLGNMYAESGHPLECVFKASRAGVRVDGAWKRPSLTFWYAVRTSKYPKGKYFLKVEIVPAFGGSPLDTSGFGLLSFKGKVPAELQ